MLTTSKIKKIFVACFLLSCSKLSAETILGHSKWQSTTHLGFGTEDKSSTGFGGTTGSAIFIDLERNTTSDLNLGMRTSAFGGKSSNGEFYRLAAGPMVNMRIMNKWNVALVLGYFKESGLDSDGDSAYESKGQMFQLGWERVFPVTKAIDVCWGGFWGRHWGDIDLSSATSSSKAGSVSQHRSVGSNIGNSRGIEFAFRVRL